MKSQIIRLILGLGFFLQGHTALAQLKDKVSVYVASSQVKMGSPALGLYVELNPDQRFRSLEATNFTFLTGCMGSYEFVTRGVLLKIEGCGEAVLLEEGDDFEITLNGKKFDQEISQELIFNKISFPFELNESAGINDMVKITLRRNQETHSQVLPSRVIKGEIYELEQQMTEILNPR